MGLRTRASFLAGSVCAIWMVLNQIQSTKFWRESLVNSLGSFSSSQKNNSSMAGDQQLYENPAWYALRNALEILSRNVSDSDVNETKRTPVGNFYLCGYVYPHIIPSWKLVFPSHQYKDFMESKQLVKPMPTDIFITNGGQLIPYCHGWPHRQQVVNITYEQWLYEFPGKILITNGESTEEVNYTMMDHMVRIGYYKDSKSTLRFRFVQLTLMQYGPQAWSKIFLPENKPISTKERFMIYASSRCVEYRDVAVDYMTEIGVVDRGGWCWGIQQNEKKFLYAPASILTTKDWHKNWVSFGMYRFCLVLENKYLDGYITEKILNAFLGGCIPIYYGDIEVFDIFNPNAFIFYNVSDPKPALARIRYLENDSVAYDRVMKEPILAKGLDTIRRYFSFTSAIGDGELISKLYKMLKL